jgi:hypothetical protein
VAETFSGGVFFIFSGEALFLEILFVFSESEHAQGLMPFPSAARSRAVLFTFFGARARIKAHDLFTRAAPLIIATP